MDPKKAGNDSASPDDRDPKSSESGYIYSYDAPGIPVFGFENESLPQGYVRSATLDFKSFACVLLHGQPILCSPIARWNLKMMAYKHGSEPYAWTLKPKQPNRIGRGEPPEDFWKLK